MTNRGDLARIDLSPYVAAVHRHDVGSVMPSFSSVDWTEDGVGNPLKLHAHRELITGVLTRAIGSDGLVISDWERVNQLPGDYAAQVSAGIDMFMEPYSHQSFETTLLAELAADRAAVDRVCGAIADCVVVVVSGRPLILTDQLGQMDALAASWLPGSQGESLADVLFRRRPFSGRSVTWPRSLDQEPINVGDRDHHPLLPYG